MGKILPRTPGQFQREESGALSVEFMIIFPVILLLIFLIIFISLLIASTSDVQQIAHELSRAAFSQLSMSNPPADVCSVLRTTRLPQLIEATLLLSADRVTLLPCPGLPDANGAIRISVSYSFAGDLVQSLGRNFGLDLGIITRTSVTFR